jgi:glycosyltransferase involved in cell wall biosynthesis
MKIAHIFTYFGDGGAEEHAILLAQKTRSSNNEVLFITSESSERAKEKLKSNNFQTINLSMRSSFNPCLVLQSALSLKKTVISQKIDIVHAHMLREQSLAVLAKILGGKFKLVRTFHRLDQFNWKMKPLLPAYFKFTDAVISTSTTMSKYLNVNGWQGRFKLVENGVTRVVVPKHAEAIGFIGRLTPEKGILKFIEANSDMLHKTKLVIAGDGPDFEMIRKVIAKNGLNVKLLGNVANKADFYEKVSVLVLPSETEVLPLVILEAYSCGLPVVAFDIESLRSLIKKDNGILIGFPDYKQMGLVASDLVKKASRYSDNNISDYRTKYSVDIMWKKTNTIYNHILKAEH